MLLVLLKQIIPRTGRLMYRRNGRSEIVSNHQAAHARPLGFAVLVGCALRRPKQRPDAGVTNRGRRLRRKQRHAVVWAGGGG